MADDSQPPTTKRQKTTYEWPLNATPPPSNDFSKQYPIDELLRPAVVKITAWDEEHGRDKDNKVVIEIPKTLLCCRSEYFDKLFNSGLKESQTGEVELKDVPHWVMRCFVGWVYHQRVYDAVHPSPAAQHAGDSDQQTDTTAADENDPNDPVTWSYDALFPLYVFGDKYHTTAFRTTIFESIQMKMLQAKPREYLYPHDSDISYAATNLPSSRPLYRLLRDICAYNYDFETDNDAASSRGSEEEIDRLATMVENLPPAFVAQCWMVSKRYARAMQCTKCKMGEKCQAHDHTAEELLAPAARKVCSYHEHDAEGEEATQCALRWSMGLSDRLIAA
ncbi:hypothetical protein LTR36_005063 [Oleoguttula mirabilis]|uniref:BTB domain-containing protein n=1 Tax=Oleoguttula mirabilis TaxID=1507867 RepID=A0AAV9JVK4_9PEZI|nr:hypothetical protein LTR36_005063 [Oleoguttula mirabilis]